MGNARIIGVLGYAGSGKSLVAKHLVERHNFTRSRFADPLKRMLKEGLSLTDEQIDGDEKHVPIARLGGQTPRHLMQTLGTDWGRRKVYFGLWVDAWRNDVGRMSGDIVVDDVRFPNEAQAIKDMGGELWRVFRPGVGMMVHPSETATGEITEDCLINNATGIKQLYNSVDTLLKVE